MSLLHLVKMCEIDLLFQGLVYSSNDVVNFLKMCEIDLLFQGLVYSSNDVVNFFLEWDPVVNW